MGARFYDSSKSAFIQQDRYMGDPGDPLSLNRYVYCGLDPVNFVDPTGFIPVWVATVTAGAIIGGVVGGGGNLILQLASNNGNWSKVSWGEVGMNFVTGIASGALAGTGVGVYASMAANAGLSGANYIGVQRINGKEITCEGLALSQIFGAVAGGISGSGMLSKEILNSAGTKKLAQFLKLNSGQEITTAQLNKLLLDASIVNALRTIAGAIVANNATN